MNVENPWPFEVLPTIVGGSREKEFVMGFMDKVKSAAQDAATQAKAATSQAQTKIEETQIKKKMDDVAKQLGYVVYAEKAQGTPATDTDRLVDEMKGLEAALAAAAQAQPAQQAPAMPTDPPPAPPVSHTDASPAPTSASEPTGGDFKL